MILIESIRFAKEKVRIQFIDRKTWQGLRQISGRGETEEGGCVSGQ